MGRMHQDIQNLFSLQGKVGLVTGGSRGIGMMIGQGLLQAGADRLYITARKADQCEAAVEKLSEYGECIAIPSDLSDDEARDKLVRRIRDEEKELHILVNNAGASWGAKYQDYPISAFEKLMKLNVTAVFALTRDLTPLLEAAGTVTDPARVINISSMESLHISVAHGMGRDFGNYAYPASKAALNHMTRHLAVTLGPHNINVNAIAPGLFISHGTRHMTREQREGAINNSLIKRLGTEADMAGAAVFLSSRAGAYASGSVLPIDGGTCVNHKHT